MTVWKTEWKTGWKGTVIWCVVLCLLIAACILLFPDLAKDQEGLNAVFSEMGAFSTAFGLDHLNFASFQGYFSVECGNVIGLGGALYSGLGGFLAFEKERSARTMSFWLSHPISLWRFYIEKWLSLVSFILLLNLCCFLTSALCIQIIHESLDGRICLLMLAYAIVQLLLGSICFGISAAFKKGTAAAGAGIAAGFWFLDLISKIVPGWSWLKNISLFGIADAGLILQKGCLPAAPLAGGIIMAAAALSLGFMLFIQQDLI